MFGTNVIMRPRDFQADTYKIQDLFYTIQGEGPLAGEPALFVRLRGCNLRCTFCDTDFESGKQDLGLTDLLAKIDELKQKARCVVITGGEPMLQDLGPLCYQIISQFGLTVQIETAGTVWPESFNNDVIHHLLRDRSIVIVCSPKTGEVVDDIAKFCTDWKYIISARDELSEVDGLPNSSTQREGYIAPLYRPRHASLTFSEVRVNQVWVQPCDEFSIAREFDHELNRDRIVNFTRNDLLNQQSAQVCAEIAMQYGYRMSVQMHKFLSLP